MPNVFSHNYSLDESISNFRVVGWYFSFLFNFNKKLLQANSGEPDQTPLFAASDLFLHCLPMSHKKDARLIQVRLRSVYRIFFLNNVISAKGTLVMIQSMLHYMHMENYCLSSFRGMQNHLASTYTLNSL